MIPKIMHYCWFGNGNMPELAQHCIASWYLHMPDWEYRLWNEKNFDITCAPVYVREAYNNKKFAFVSDWVRLWALESIGGLYMDVDFEVYKPFDDLMERYDAFAGIEGSKRHPVMMGVIASKPHGEWVREMMRYYEGRHFLLLDGLQDLTPNVTFLTAKMLSNGFKPTGEEQNYKDLHIFPTDYFSPRQTTGEYLRTKNTYCETKSLNSWRTDNIGVKQKLLNIMPSSWRVTVIKLKRLVLG